MRRIIAAMQMSLDGFIEGPDGENDWVLTWEDQFGLIDQVDTFILGAGMYIGYEQYWSAVLRDPKAPLPFSDRPATPGEIAFAEFASKTPHIVLSTKLREVTWPVARIVRDIEAIRALKPSPGKDIHAVGGATLVSGLLNAGLVDELRVIINPVVLGGGKAMFKDMSGRLMLTPRGVNRLALGQTLLTYDVQAAHERERRQLSAR
jgi:dihydrofolate reductase